MTPPESTVARPLAGIRVIDFSMFVAGPCCTRSLADAGADVIKIEPPEGDNLRTRPPKREGCSSYYGHLNAGKRSVILDLKRSDALDVAKTLVSTADIVVENGRPGAMKRFGLDYETLSKSNPRLIYCSISGYGQTGPGADRPAYAQTVQAASGHDLAFMGYQDGQERPSNTGIFVADILAGVYSLSAVMTALYQRERTGRGQFVDVAMMDAMMNLLPYEFQEAQFPSKERRLVYKPLKTLDGYLMVALVSPKNFEKLFETIGHPEWKSDLRFSTTESRYQNWDLLMGFVEEWTCRFSSNDCAARLSAAGIPATLYQTVKEAMLDPQLAHRGSFSEVSDAAGKFLVPNLPFKMSDANVDAQGFVAGSGEHTAEVLAELAGLTPEGIRSLSEPTVKK